MPVAKRWWSWLTLFAAGWVCAQTPPHLGSQGQADYRDYLAARDHRAFAIAPGGAWGWQAEAATRDDAVAAALAACRGNTPQRCVLYSADGRPEFDVKTWPRLWGPYADAATARKAVVGRRPGERFPDLAFTAADGRQLSVASLAGRVAVLHFWGSWCAPCRREMPDLQRLYDGMKSRRDVAFVLLQVREKFAVSRQWATAQGLHLPLHDSGAGGEDDARLRTADGASIGDREIAGSFPTTYVIDKRGLVLFSHVGPIADWNQYRAFLLDAAARSGR